MSEEKTPTPLPEAAPTPETKNFLPVLYVDDDPESFNLIVSIAIKEAGLKKDETASTTKEGVTKLYTGRYALVITDGLNGGWARVAEAAKAKNIPVILLTTEPDSYKKEAAEKNVPIVSKGKELIPNLVSAINQCAIKE